jgi:low affinity Fe/Cu permease
MDKKHNPDEIVTFKKKINKIFRHMAERTSRIMGTPQVFFVAIFLIVVWALSGLYFEFSDTWQLIINTATTIGTFLIVILIQNTQYRDARSIHLKLDELIRGTKNSRNRFLEIEEQSDEEIDELKAEFKKLREEYIEHLKEDLEKKLKKRRKKAKAKKKS